jgi:hypothetical protein
VGLRGGSRGGSPGGSRGRDLAALRSAYAAFIGAVHAGATDDRLAELGAELSDEYKSSTHAE